LRFAYLLLTFYRPTGGSLLRQGSNDNLVC
jgi:hypothetical protein